MQSCSQQKNGYSNQGLIFDVIKQEDKDRQSADQTSQSCSHCLIFCLTLTDEAACYLREISAYA
jgi:hypothetical protein